MNGKMQIKQALQAIKSSAEINGGQVYRGFGNDGTVEATGWWFRPFNGQPWFLGTTIAEALQEIEAQATQQSEVQGEMD